MNDSDFCTAARTDGPRSDTIGRFLPSLASVCWWRLAVSFATDTWPGIATPPYVRTVNTSWADISQHACAPVVVPDIPCDPIPRRKFLIAGCAAV